MYIVLYKRLGVKPWKVCETVFNTRKSAEIHARIQLANQSWYRAAVQHVEFAPGVDPEITRG